LWFIRLIIVLAPILYFGGDCGFTGETPSSNSFWSNLVGAPIPQATINLRQQIVYVGNLLSAAKGRPVTVLELQSLANGTTGSLLTGTVRIRGKITAQTAGTALPTKMRLQTKLKRGNAVLLTEFWDFKVLSTGVIPAQNFPITQIARVQLRDVIQFSILPLDRNFPASTGNLIINYSAGKVSFSKEVEIAEEVEVAAAVQKFQLTFVGPLPPSPANQVAGAVNLKAIRGPLLTWNGNLNVRGKVTPLVAGTQIPNTIRLTIKHKRALNGTVRRTESFTVNVQTNGLVALQSFPFTTINGSNIRESLEISITPVSRSFPLCSANLILSFTALPGT
jgi:hypothetical protein